MDETHPVSRGTPPKRRLFLESRYRKLVRGLPQTIFFCPVCKGRPRERAECATCAGRGKLFDDSVQELIGRAMLPAFRAKFGKFHGAGREDVDVRMLGRGRPFVYELVEPKRIDIDLEDLLARIHAKDGTRLSLDPFRIVAKERVAHLKSALYSKVYRAEVEFDGDVAERALGALREKPIAVMQRTPQRVAHRRGDLDRPRTVEVLTVAAAGPRACVVELRCEHGTYVKEWIDGDGDRTTPSLAGLVGVGAHCKALDVLEVLDAVDGA